jgi:hypothetical protein
LSVLIYPHSFKARAAPLSARVAIIVPTPPSSFSDSVDGRAPKTGSHVTRSRALTVF